MLRSNWVCCAVCTVIVSGLLVSAARAEITVLGDVDPADPAAWNTITTAIIGNTGSGTLYILGDMLNSRDGSIGHQSGSEGLVLICEGTWMNMSLYVGYYGSGRLSIMQGGVVENDHGSIGSRAGSMGEVSVEGARSRWVTNRLQLGMCYLSPYMGTGNSGSGRLSIMQGGVVDVTGTTEVTFDPIAKHEIHFENGTLNTGSLLAGASHLTGVGTINTHGFVSDVDLVFDSADDSTQAVVYAGQPGQSITINLNVDGQSVLGAGCTGSGSLAISNGVEVLSTCGYIGYQLGSDGEATVKGLGTRWENRQLYVGLFGSGTLSIKDGGLVIARDLDIDYDSSGDSFIKMASGGMLALYGDGDDSLAVFLGMIQGTDAILYWDDAISDWASITGATYGEDYTLAYHTEGDLAGYTVLTVHVVPEPVLVSLLALGGLVMRRRKRRI